MKNHTTPPKFVDTFGSSHVGSKRKSNGDQFIVAELKRAATVQHASISSLDDSRRFGANQANVLLVADGVSGQKGAASASRVVVEEVMESILNVLPWTPQLDLGSEANLRDELKQTVLRCNDEVQREARRVPDKARMGSTLTLAFVRWPTAFIVHAGDSRAYLIRDGRIDQLTTDHTVAQQMVDRGEIEPEKAETSRFANMLWNAVGGSSDVTPELTVRNLEGDDSLLLCSDGLTSYLNDDSIRKIVDAASTSEEACHELVESITSIGGHDDVTVALARFLREIPVKEGVAPSPKTDEAAAAVEIPKSEEASVVSADQPLRPQALLSPHGISTKR